MYNIDMTVLAFALICVRVCVRMCVCVHGMHACVTCVRRCGLATITKSIVHILISLHTKQLSIRTWYIPGF